MRRCTGRYRPPRRFARRWASEFRWACAAEMAFAAGCGVTLNIDVVAVDPLALDAGDYRIRAEQLSSRRNDAVLKALFSEEPGCLIQVRRSERALLMDALRAAGLGP